MLHFEVTDEEDCTSPETFELRPMAWDDWFKYQTSFRVTYVGPDLKRSQIGVTKIGKFGLMPASANADTEGFRKPRPPQRFTKLPEEFFSLAQDVDFYTRLEKISPTLREQVCIALRDIAYDEVLYRDASTEDVTKVSLMRAVSSQAIEGQFNRVAHGHAVLTKWDFDITVGDPGKPSVSLGFHVDPDSWLPTNLQVIIGRNGVGKSWFLNRLARTIVEISEAEDPYGDFWDMDEDSIDEILRLTNLVSVSFSAFDQFEPLSIKQDRSKGISYHYVGLKRIGARNEATRVSPLKGQRALAAELTMSVQRCLASGKRDRWLHALSLLEGDPVFASIGISNVFRELDDEDALSALKDMYRGLSSGHSIVLLTISRLVETVQERTLVLLDEPEAHLHPPLISALIRAISELLQNQNGVAIIVTHSPVVLQEVPNFCVHKLARSGWQMHVSEASVETFGENVGTLTDEVFGLEVTATGYHKILRDLVQDGLTYDEIIETYLGGHLGAEGRALLSALIDVLNPAAANHNRRR